MFSDENTLTISGKIISEVVVKPTKSGGKMVTFSIANNYSEVDEDGKIRTETSLINIVAWGEQAQLLAAGRPVISKRDYVRVTGRLSVNRVERGDGSKVTYSQIILTEVQSLDRSNDKRLSGAGTAGGNAFKHYSQHTIADRYSPSGLMSQNENGQTHSLYNAEVDGSQQPSLAEEARRTRWEDEQQAEIIRQTVPAQTKKPQQSPKSATKPGTSNPSPTRLVNRKAHVAYDIYIGRPTKWGNPFKIGEDGNREEVIEKYREWITGQPYLLNSLPELRGKTLACWCSPEACHGDVLLELLEKTAHRC